MRIEIVKTNTKKQNLKLIDSKLRELRIDRAAIQEHIDYLEDMREEIKEGVYFKHSHSLIIP